MANCRKYKGFKMKKITLLVAFLVLSLFIYLSTIRGVWGNPAPEDFKNNLDQTTKPLELSPERGRYALVMSLVENHSFALSKTLTIATYPDVATALNGKNYIYFGPSVSIMAIPFYILGKHFNLAQVFTFSLSSIFAMLNILIIYKIGKNILKLPFWASLFAGLVFAFGSTAWDYAITLYQHHVTTFLILSSFYAVWNYKKNTKLSNLYACWPWLAYAISITVDYPNALLMLPVMVYFFLSSFGITKIKDALKISFRPALIFASTVFITVMILFATYNQVNFGSWKTLSGSLTGVKSTDEKQLTAEQKSTADLQSIQNRKNPITFFTEQQFPVGLNTLTFSPDRGLFLYSPIFALAVFGILGALRRINLEKATLIATVLLLVFLYSSWGDPWGGWAFGPRYLIPALAILSLFISSWLTGAKYNLARKISAFLLFAYSAAVTLLGALTTNAVPPKSEADLLHTHYNFLFNYPYLLDNRSSSFIFNDFLSQTISLTWFYSAIFLVLLTICAFILFVLPKFKSYDD